MTEELCKYYNKDFGIEFRIARFHNIYGPQGTWKGGREKVTTPLLPSSLITSIGPSCLLSQGSLLHARDWV